MAITLDEFFEMARLGGEIQAYHDIIELMDSCEDSAEFSNKLTSNFKLINQDFRKAALKFKSNAGRVRFDEESIDSLPVSPDAVSDDSNGWIVV